MAGVVRTRRQLVNQEGATLLMATLGIAYFIDGLGQSIFGSDIYKLNIGMPKEPVMAFESVFPGGILVDKEDLIVNGYRNEFCRIILSMLNNSRKILMMNKTENPSISIRLTGRNGRCVVSIHDNGGCIPDQAIDGIFEPHSSAGLRGSGNGMALYMTKEIVERMKKLLSE